MLTNGWSITKTNTTAAWENTNEIGCRTAFSIDFLRVQLLSGGKEKTTTKNANHANA
jgi:hypothetical protein